MRFNELFVFDYSLSYLLSPSLISIFAHNILETTVHIILFKLCSFGMNDGGMLKVRLETIVEFCWDDIESVLDCFKDISSFTGVDEYKTTSLVILVEIGVSFLPSPEVSKGDIAWTSGIAEMAFAATVAEHYMLIENVCKTHFTPPPLEI